jgi:hypothetical protein
MLIRFRLRSNFGSTVVPRANCSKGPKRSPKGEPQRTPQLKLDRTRAVIREASSSPAIPGRVHIPGVTAETSNRYMLIDIARPENLFHTAVGTAFADIMIEGHRETWPIRSKRFRAFLRRCHYQATGEAVSAAEIRSVLELLEARAQFDGPERAVHIRTAEHAGHIYLDLADEHWHAVDIGPDGWRIIERPPVRFCRPAGMLPLPFPERGGSIETLQSCGRSRARSAS